MPRSTTKNHLLLGLSEDAFERLRPHLEHQDAPHGKILYDAFQKITHVYFPEASVASIVAHTAEGQSCEIGIVGREGAVGLETLFGIDQLPHNAFIQIPDGCFRLPVAVLRSEFNEFRVTRDQLLLFNYKLMMQVSQTTLCNRLHSVEERLIRWLLLCHDRVDGDILLLTQEFLSIMLGVSRVSVTLSARTLQSTGYISYRRGVITIHDRAALEELTCDCYAIVRREYDQN